MNNPQQTWKQTYEYDKYGNRTAFTQNIHGENLAINNITLPQVNAATNRFNGGQDYEYDKIGNLTKDVAKVNGVTQSRDIKFNGDNKQIEIKDSSAGIKIGEYFYDGSGKRVKKRLFDANGVAKDDVIFIYSGDKLVAEYSTLPPPTNPTTKYVATDTLGSIRAMTNEYGEVVSRRDFMPFGEKLQADATYRKANLTYNPDDVRQKFTGYQKDEETGLDFAEARMYNNSHARFTAVDPLLASGKSANPQTFNRYVYVMNNPLAYTDPDGLQAGRNPIQDELDSQKNESTRTEGLKLRITNVKVFNGTFRKTHNNANLRDKIADSSTGTNSEEAPYGFNISANYQLTNQGKGVEGKEIFEDVKVEGVAVVPKNNDSGEVGDANYTDSFSGPVADSTTDKNGNLTDEPLGLNSIFPIRKHKITQTLYIVENGNKNILLTNTITATTNFDITKNGGVRNVSSTTVKITNNQGFNNTIVLETPERFRRKNKND